MSFYLEQIIGKSDAINAAIADAIFLGNTSSRVILIENGGNVEGDLFAKIIDNSGNLFKFDSLNWRTSFANHSIMDSVRELENNNDKFSVYFKNLSVLNEVEQKCLIKLLDYNGLHRIVLVLDREVKDLEAGKFKDKVRSLDKIRIPLLNERSEDIPYLVEALITFFSTWAKIDTEVANRLKEYKWQGNFDELVNVFEEAREINSKKEIRIADVNEVLAQKKSKFDSQSVAEISVNDNDVKDKKTDVINDNSEKNVYEISVDNNERKVRRKKIKKSTVVDKVSKDEIEEALKKQEKKLEIESRKKYAKLIKIAVARERDNQEKIREEQIAKIQERNDQNMHDMNDRYSGEIDELKEVIAILRKNLGMSDSSEGAPEIEILRKEHEEVINRYKKQIADLLKKSKQYEEKEVNGLQQIDNYFQSTKQDQEAVIRYKEQITNLSETIEWLRDEIRTLIIKNDKLQEQSKRISQAEYNWSCTSLEEDRTETREEILEELRVDFDEKLLQQKKQLKSKFNKHKKLIQNAYTLELHKLRSLVVGLECRLQDICSDNTVNKQKVQEIEKSNEKLIAEVERYKSKQEEEQLSNTLKQTVIDEMTVTIEWLNSLIVDLRVNLHQLSRREKDQQDALDSSEQNKICLREKMLELEDVVVWQSDLIATLRVSQNQLLACLSSSNDSLRLEKEKALSEINSLKVKLRDAIPTTDTDDIKLEKIVVPGIEVGITLKKAKQLFESFYANNKMHFLGIPKGSIFLNIKSKLVVDTIDYCSNDLQKASKILGYSHSSNLSRYRNQIRRTLDTELSVRERLQSEIARLKLKIDELETEIQKQQEQLVLVSVYNENESVLKDEIEELKGQISENEAYVDYLQSCMKNRDEEITKARMSQKTTERINHEIIELLLQNDVLNDFGSISAQKLEEMQEKILNDVKIKAMIAFINELVILKYHGRSELAFENEKLIFIKKGILNVEALNCVIEDLSLITECADARAWYIERLIHYEEMRQLIQSNNGDLEKLAKEIQVPYVELRQIIKEKGLESFVQECVQGKSKNINISHNFITRTDNEFSQKRHNSKPGIVPKAMIISPEAYCEELADLLVKNLPLIEIDESKNWAEVKKMHTWDILCKRAMFLQKRDDEFFNSLQINVSFVLNYITRHNRAGGSIRSILDFDDVIANSYPLDGIEYYPGFPESMEKSQERRRLLTTLTWMRRVNFVQKDVSGHIDVSYLRKSVIKDQETKKLFGKIKRELNLKTPNESELRKLFLELTRSIFLNY